MRFSDVSEDLFPFLLWGHVLAASIRIKKSGEQSCLGSNALFVGSADECTAVAAIVGVISGANLVLRKAASEFAQRESIFDPCTDLFQEVEIQADHSAGAFVFGRADKVGVI